MSDAYTSDGKLKGAWSLFARPTFSSLLTLLHSVSTMIRTALRFKRNCLLGILLLIKNLIVLKVSAGLFVYKIPVS